MMIIAQFTSVTDTRENLKQFHPASVKCECGRMKSPDHSQCAHCARHIGPYVIVKSPSGNYVECGGLESAESLIARMLLGIMRPEMDDTHPR